jgi:hypothetical protein
MAFIPAENVAKVTVNMEVHDQKVTNNLYVRNAAGWSTAELEALADLIILQWNDNFGPIQSVNCLYTSVIAVDLTEEEGAGVEISFPAASGGDVANPAMPGNVALAVRFKTGLRGRARTGKNFFTGLCESQQEGNEITLAVRDSIVAAYGLMRDDLQGAGYEHVVVSFYDGFTLVEYPDGTTRKVPTPRGEGLVTPVVSYVADTFIDSQRRRLAGRGQ